MKSYEDVAFEVCTKFHEHGIKAILVGGGAATYYAPEAYQTRDLDFVLHVELFAKQSTRILDELGYRTTRTVGTYEHPDSPFTLEIIPGPVGIGEQIITEFNSVQRGQQVLHVLKPTDSAKDRLAHAIHFHDLSAAQQAAHVAKKSEVDMGEIESWCRSEGGERQFQFFLRFLQHTEAE